MKKSAVLLLLALSGCATSHVKIANDSAAPGSWFQYASNGNVKARAIKTGDSWEITFFDDSKKVTLLMLQELLQRRNESEAASSSAGAEIAKWKSQAETKPVCPACPLIQAPAPKTSGEQETILMPLKEIK